MDRLHTIQKLINLTNKIGYFNPKVVPQLTSNKGLIMVAKQPIPKYEMILSIPKDKCFEFKDRAEGDIKLVDALKNKNSSNDEFIAQHIASFPSIPNYSYKNYFIPQTKYQLNTCTGIKWESERKNFIEVLKHFKQESYQDVLWADGILTSRSFCFRDLNGQYLVPLLDIFNHKSLNLFKEGCLYLPGYSNTNPSKLNFMLFSSQNYNQDDELFIDYGNLSFQKKIVDYDWFDDNTDFTQQTYFDLYLGLLENQNYNNKVYDMIPINGNPKTLQIAQSKYEENPVNSFTFEEIMKKNILYLNSLKLLTKFELIDENVYPTDFDVRYNEFIKIVNYEIAALEYLLKQLEIGLQSNYKPKAEDLKIYNEKDFHNLVESAEKDYNITLSKKIF